MGPRKAGDGSWEVCLSENRVSGADHSWEVLWAGYFSLQGFHLNPLMGWTSNLPLRTCSRMIFSSGGGWLKELPVSDFVRGEVCILGIWEKECLVFLLAWGSWSQTWWGVCNVCVYTRWGSGKQILCYFEIWLFLAGILHDSSMGFSEG